MVDRDREGGAVEVVGMTNPMPWSVR
jgi:hypothetical protein